MRGPAINVLLVEDNPDDADVLQEVLAASGAAHVTMTHVETLAAARQRLAATGFDVVLLDLSLPDAHGLQGVTRLRAEAPAVPIVVLTGLDDDAIGTGAVQAGAQDYLVKGQADALALLRCVRYAIERHRLQEERAAETAMWEALSHVGEELMTSLNTGVLVNRLSRLTTTVLQCDFTLTWLWNSEQQAYAAVADHGDLPPGWEQMRGAKVPREPVEGLLSALERSDVVQFVVGQPQAFITPGVWPDPPETTAILCMALRRGGEVIGGQACGYRKRTAPFTARQERLAKGLVHLVSLAMENARLVEELDRTNRINAYFAATMSHELRGGLSVIIGFTNVLLSEAAEHLQPDEQRMLEDIDQRCRESLDLIKASLEISRSDAVSTPSEHKEIEVAELIATLARETGVPSEKPDLRLHWEVAPNVPHLFTDPLKLKMILQNLVGNALKFTARGSVDVEVSAADGRVEFVVRDTGIGIPATELGGVFEPFRQAHGSQSRRAGGAGLGLYIVRRLVGLLGGEIAVESDTGRGTAFHFWIPQHGSDAGAAA